MVKAILIGAWSGAVLFTLAVGADVTPLVLIGGIALLVEMLVSGRLTEKKFTVVGGAAGAGRRQALSFADIGGQQVAVRELVEALEFIKNEESAVKMGIRPLRGILLAGPPGTGKTLLARAAASYTQAVFVSVAGSDFIEMYAGVGAKRVRDLFASARSAAAAQGSRTAVVFIDEIDVLGAVRGRHASHMEYDQTLNQLLVEMDGLTSSGEDVRILVMAATNRADLLDPALLRPGRFDRTVSVDLPDAAGRLEILKIHTASKPVADDVDLEAIAREAYGFSGAHLESLANEAAILALRAGRDRITATDFSDAIEKVIMGERIERRPDEEQMKRVAVHELGHAIVSEVLSPGSVASITVAGRGKALGYVRHAPKSDNSLETRGDIEQRICTLVAGTVSERLILGEGSTGASQDVAQALEAARLMVKCGLSDAGIVSEDDMPKDQYHDIIAGLVRAGQERATSIIAARRDRLVELAAFLCKEERMDGDSFRASLNQAA
ncbi:MAG: ATP-dependent zinc metalloprotease FtsH [Firmicutes bacterium ADurb.Bin506]|jgi:cell division protease FtsH|nr:MAG: ATP-dependent zinc metalloprotease FtsH [Firmicutes bacterium ADurb.Bin506]